MANINKKQTESCGCGGIEAGKPPRKTHHQRPPQLDGENGTEAKKRRLQDVAALAMAGLGSPLHLAVSIENPIEVVSRGKQASVFQQLLHDVHNPTSDNKLLPSPVKAVGSTPFTRFLPNQASIGTAPSMNAFGRVFSFEAQDDETDQPVFFLPNVDGIFPHSHTMTPEEFEKWLREQGIDPEDLPPRNWDRGARRSI